MRISRNLNPQGKDLALLVVVPHDSVNLDFLDDHPEFAEHSLSERNQELFSRYIHLEADRGATELAKAIASICQASLLERGEINATVELFRIDYPRGVIDGGRVSAHSIRPLVTDTSRFTEIDHASNMKNIQRDTIKLLDQKLEALNQANGLLLDIHTMAPCDPFASPTPNWENLASYIQSFYSCLTPERERPLDLLTSDDEGQFLAERGLFDAVLKSLETIDSSITVKENTPYRVSKPYLMHYLLTHAKGLAIDVPKHLIAEHKDGLENFDIEGFTVCQKKTNRIAKAVAKATLETLGFS